MVLITIWILSLNICRRSRRSCLKKLSPSSCTSPCLCCFLSLVCRWYLPMNKEDISKERGSLNWANLHWTTHFQMFSKKILFLQDLWAVPFGFSGMIWHRVNQLECHSSTGGQWWPVGLWRPKYSCMLSICKQRDAAPYWQKSWWGGGFCIKHRLLLEMVLDNSGQLTMYPH